MRAQGLRPARDSRCSRCAMVESVDSEDLVGGELVEVGHVGLALELEPHLAQPGRPQFQFGVEVKGPAASRERACTFAKGSEVKSFFLPVMP